MINNFNRVSPLVQEQILETSSYPSDQDILVYRLYSLVGISAVVQLLIRSSSDFLIMSNFTDIMTGEHQASVLGPLLFLGLWRERAKHWNWKTILNFFFRTRCSFQTFGPVWCLGGASGERECGNVTGTKQKQNKMFPAVTFSNHGKQKLCDWLLMPTHSRKTC